MSVSEKFSGITQEDLLEVADRFGVRRAENTLSDVNLAIDNWSEIAEDANIPVSGRNRLAKGFVLIGRQR